MILEPSKNYWDKIRKVMKETEDEHDGAEIFLKSLETLQGLCCAR